MKPRTTTSNPSRLPAFQAGRVLQRQCTCGQHAEGGECEECRKKKEVFQRQRAGGPEPAGVPPGVHEVLRAPGEPLAPAARRAMESHFSHDFSRVRLRVPAGGGPQSEPIVNEPGDAFEREAERVAAAVGGASEAPRQDTPRQDFSQVRVHADGRAADAAQSLNARAFAFGHHVVFGAGQLAPETPAGARLLAHELTHVVQQGASPARRIARAPLDLKRLDTELFLAKPLTQTSGEIGKSASCSRGDKKPPELPIEAFVYPSNTEDVPGQGGKPAKAGGTLPGGASGSAETADKTAEKPAAEPTGAAKEWPPKSSRKIANHPDRSDWRKDSGTGLLVPPKRAVIVGGIHGNERGPLDVAQGLKASLDAGAPRDFDTIFIPVINPGGVADKTRENRCGVDLNRNFPGLTGAKAAKGKVDAEQPETRAVRDVIETLKPSRILALHAVAPPEGSDVAPGGVFADPAQDPKAAALACRMAVRMQNKPGAKNRNVNVAGNKLDTGFCSALYPIQSEVGVSDKQSSLGIWASAPVSQGGLGIPVITHEVSKKSPLDATGDRSVAAILPGVEEFLLDNEHLPSEEGGLLASSVSDDFLTGESKSADDSKVRAEIERRVGEDFKKLQKSYKAKRLPTWPATLTVNNDFRSFKTQGGIVGRALKAQKPRVTDKSTDKEIADAILQVMTTRSIPGFSRHAWGTEIDVLEPTKELWEAGGKLEKVGDFLKVEAPAFGFFHPYSKTPPDPGLRHYVDEPWHISYGKIADILQREWQSRFTGPKLEALIKRTAIEIAGPIKPERLESILKTLNLEQFQTNIAPAPSA